MRYGLYLPEARVRGAVLGVLLLAAPVAAAAQDALTARIDAALLRMGPHATAAVRVLAPSRGAVLYERNPDLSLNPASNEKLLTSAAALAKLGPEYRFSTRVLASAPVKDGVLRGDLTLQGGGDPVLTTEHLAALADRVHAAGIRRVTGKLLADDYRYDAERLGNGWNSDDEPFYYSAQISALSVNRNVLTVDVSPGPEPGAPVIVGVQPVPDHMKILSSAVTGAPGSQTRIDVTRQRARNEVRVTGSIAAGAQPVMGERVTVEEPQLYAAALFRHLLAERGVRVEGPTERGKTADGAAVIAAHESEPLSSIVARLNKPSDNLIAEMLLKELGYAVKQSGSASAGGDVIEGWLKDIGIDTGGVRVRDGSGLSRLDLVTARAVSELLIHASKQPWKDVFVASLPIGGVDGTLRNRMKGTPAEKNVRAKTGTLTHVTALSGYVTTASGEPLVFSILINNYPGPSTGPMGSKRIEDLIATALAEL